MISVGPEHDTTGEMESPMGACKFDSIAIAAEICVTGATHIN